VRAGTLATLAELVAPHPTASYEPAPSAEPLHTREAAPHASLPLFEEDRDARNS
jgi:hypothetical protein